ncbi:MAG: CopD family protein [Candidatus Poribacteria bacterium]|nr:CopD family protein [Candidatus Poribacteria bacterium]
MEILDVLILWLHVTAAAIWVGGNLMMAMVVVPYFRRTVSPVERIKILTQIGQRFEPIGWGAVLVLIFSGLFNIFSSGVLNSPELLGPFMRMLGIKLILVLILIVLTAIHGFIMGPRLAQAVEALEPGTEELPEPVNKMRGQMAVVSSLIGVFSLLVLLAAVALRMGI